MKILILTSRIDGESGGWGRYSSGLVEALRAIGNTCLVFTEKDGRGDFERLPSYAKYRLNYLLAPLYAWRLRKYAKECDLIHSLIEPYASIAYWLSLFSNKPYFITAHGTYATMPYRYAVPFRNIHKTVFKKASIIIAVSEYTRKRLKSFGLKNLSVIQNGIEYKDLPLPEKRVSFEERENILLTVGGVKRRKGQHISLDAFARIAEKFPEIRYWIVGEQKDQAYFSELKERIQGLGLEDRVVFKSDVSDKELFYLYSRAKVFVLSAISDSTHFEGFGLVYLEANACGTPTIGSYESGAEDAIKNGETGVLTKPGDIDSVASAIEILLFDREKWEALSTSGITWSKDHDWQKVVYEYTALYRKI